MNDTRSASLVLIAGAAGVAYWWYHLQRGALVSPAPAGDTPGGLPNVSAKPGSRLPELEAFARHWGLRITSEYRLDPSSLHSEGRAIDVVGTLTAQAKADAAALGIHILEEAPGQVGANGSVSTGWHYHLSFPEIRNGHEVF